MMMMMMRRLYLSKAAFFKGVGHFKRKFQVEGDVNHQPLLVWEN